VIGQIFGHFGHMDFLLAEFATLCAVGWVLVMARLRTGRLWAGIGLHAGWVFGLKYFSSLTRGSKELRAGEWLPWIGTNLKIGLVPLVVVLLTGWIVLRLAKGWNRAERLPP
jgi:membrane protease YdiL (CAAX protease family)